jgi:sterol desaturase/sphingolipid hydroxylase (fatty acid hydroxylase superfamily)
VHLAFQHANLDYSLGPLRHLFGVAQTHRWHHKRDYEDAQVNFGEWLMLWDHLFRTYRQPPGRIGQGDVGLDSRDAPSTYHRQLLRPFL